MALITVERNYCVNKSLGKIHRRIEFEPSERNGSTKSVNECYFAVKSAALVLPHDECIHVCKRLSKNTANDIQKHLESMFYLLRAEDTLKMAVKLESAHPGRTRYLVVINVSYSLSPNNGESCLLGVDCNDQTTIGLVVPIWADTRITLDGDGGFSITSSNSHHIFKPVSVQAMWSALQTLHKVSAKARENNYFAGGTTHSWVDFYEGKINSDRSCLNEWHAMDDIIYKRPLSPDIRAKPLQQDETEKLIRAKLKEVMMSVDLEEVTSKCIRTKLETELDADLSEFKSFIDQEMLTILGQMDEASEIFDYLYLGSEWNASNLEEMKGKGISKILNVTREIDNFFPDAFEYYNVRVYDDDSTEMLKYWDKTFKYIKSAKEEGSKILVHCKMGISRSASVVIAYVMKAYNWSLEKAFEFVKKKRNCIRPNPGFVTQLEIYQGILEASKQRHSSLWKSKSETNLSSKDFAMGNRQIVAERKANFKIELNPCENNKENMQNLLSLPGNVQRPKSWSPNDNTVNEMFSNLESVPSQVGTKENKFRRSQTGRQRFYTDTSCYLIFQARKNVLDLYFQTNSQRNSSVKERICEIEANPYPQLNLRPPSEAVKINSKAGFVLNLASQFEATQTLSKDNLIANKEVLNDMSNFNSSKKQAVHSKPPMPRMLKSSYNQVEKVKSEKFKFSCDKFENIKSTKRNRLNSESQLHHYEQFYNDVGFLPFGNVKETKKKIEEYGSKKTSSLENISFSECSNSSNHSKRQLNNEEQSLQSHRRSKSLFINPQKWVQTTCLTSNKKPVIIKSNLTHSKSTPSVFEAVNEVLSNTQIILNSAIESLPRIKTDQSREKTVKEELFNSQCNIYSNKFLIKKSNSMERSFCQDVDKEMRKERKIDKNTNSRGVVKKITKEIEEKSNKTNFTW